METPQIQLHKHHDTEYENILNSPPALCLVNVVTKYRSLIGSHFDSIYDHPILKSMFIILKIQNQSEIQSKCQLQSLKNQRSAFPVQLGEHGNKASLIGSHWCNTRPSNSQIHVYHTKYPNPISDSILVPNPNSKKSTLSLPGLNKGHQLEWIGSKQVRTSTCLKLETPASQIRTSIFRIHK